MTKSSKSLYLYLSILLTATSLAVILRSLALLVHLDENLIYFTSGVLNLLSTVIIVAFCVFAISYFFIPGQKLSPASSFSNPQTYIPSGLSSIALVFAGTELIYAFQEISRVAHKNSNTILPAILILSILFAFASVFCFFLNVFFEKRESRLRAAFTLTTVIFLALYSSYLFFSNDLPLNAPNKSVDLMAHIALSVFFLYETRISLGRSMWKAYVAFGMIAAALAFFSSIPSLVFYFANDLTSDAVISASISENVLVLVLGIYAVCRLSLVATLVPDETCSMALAVEKMAEIRENEILESESESKTTETEQKNEQSHSNTHEGSNYEIDISALADITTTPSGDTSQEKE